MLTTVLAASSDSTAEAVGTIIGRVLILGLGAVLLVIGLRRRTATAGSRGTVMAVIGGVILVLGLLGAVTSVAMSSA